MRNVAKISKKMDIPLFVVKSQEREVEKEKSRKRSREREVEKEKETRRTNEKESQTNKESRNERGNVLKEMVLGGATDRVYIYLRNEDNLRCHRYTEIKQSLTALGDGQKIQLLMMFMQREKFVLYFLSF